MKLQVFPVSKRLIRLISTSDHGQTRKSLLRSNGLRAWEGASLPRGMAARKYGGHLCGLATPPTAGAPRKTLAVTARPAGRDPAALPHPRPLSRLRLQSTPAGTGTARQPRQAARWPQGNCQPRCRHPRARQEPPPPRAVQLPRGLQPLRRLQVLPGQGNSETPQFQRGNTPWQRPGPTSPRSTAQHTDPRRRSPNEAH